MKSPFGFMTNHIKAVKAAGQEPISSQLHNFDCLGELIWANKSVAKPLVDGLQQEIICDKMWNYFLLNVSDTTLVRPDEYNYNRNFVHAPIWTALLYTKIGAFPPIVVPPSTGRNPV
jgi:hypothetical protein